MPSRENIVILGFIAVAVTAAVGSDTAASLPSWLPFAILLGLGVIAPLLVNNYLDTHNAS